MDESASGLVEAYVSALESCDWNRVHDLLHPDVVYELPQSRERIVGRDPYVRPRVEFEKRDAVAPLVTDFWAEPYDPPPGREHSPSRWTLDGRIERSRSLMLTARSRPAIR